MRLSRQRIVTCVASVDRRSQGSLGEGRLALTGACPIVATSRGFLVLLGL